MTVEEAIKKSGTINILAKGSTKKSTKLNRKWRKHIICYKYKLVYYR